MNRILYGIFLVDRIIATIKASLHHCNFCISGQRCFVSGCDGISEASPTSDVLGSGIWIIESFVERKFFRLCTGSTRSHFLDVDPRSMYLKFN